MRAQHGRYTRGVTHFSGNNATRIFLQLAFSYPLTCFFLRRRTKRAVGMIDRLDGIKRDKEIKCTRIRRPSLPFVQINTRYACNYARASNFVLRLVKAARFPLTWNISTFPPRSSQIQTDPVYAVY